MDACSHAFALIFLPEKLAGFKNNTYLYIQFMTEMIFVKL
jgi:hypothetical protein